MEASRKSELLACAVKFHTDHPEVWELFVKFTFEKIHTGFTHYSAKGVFERIRWQTAHPERKENEFKLNNNLTPFYARWFGATYLAYSNFFRTRRQISGGKSPVNLPELLPDYFDD